MTLTRFFNLSGTVPSVCLDRHPPKSLPFLKHRSHQISLPITLSKRSTNLISNSFAGSPGLPGLNSYEVDLNRGKSGQESITAKIRIHASVKIVWEVLTNFSKLVDVVPNLIACEELPSPNAHTKRIRQSAGLKCSWWRLQAEAILDLQSYTRSNGNKELYFQMIQGDFKEYHGRFSVEADGLSSVLTVEVVIEPLESVPEMLFVHAVQIWLPFNLNGIVKRAEQIALKQTKISPFTAASIEEEVSLGSGEDSTTRMWYNRTMRAARRRRKELHKLRPADYLGTAFVPLPAKAPEFKDVPRAEEETIPKFELTEGGMEGVEVHLRKLDTEQILHRRVICSLGIRAPVEQVWAILTDYERLPEFIPNLAESEVLPGPRQAPERYKRLKQVVKKRQSYLQLQAESVMDIVERPWKEIQFRQIYGFVERLQGKFLLKRLETEWEEEDTLLTYALELKTAHSEIPLELIEPVFEQAAVEGLPLNLTALRQEILKSKGRFSLARLCGDFEALRDSLVISYGSQDENYLPTRDELRRDHMSHLEKAISAHGGALSVSQRMGWKIKSKSRKRRGYWDDFTNVEQEIIDFRMEVGLPDDHVLTKTDFNQAGRVDLRRAVEKWGGIQAVMELMELGSLTDSSLKSKQKSQKSKMKINIRDLDDIQ